MFDTLGKPEGEKKTKKKDQLSYSQNAALLLMG